LGQYALHIGLALVVLIAALAAWAILHKRRAIRRDTEIDTGRPDPALHDLRREFRQAIEAAQATASGATTIGEKVIAAVKPIEAALRNLSSRLSELEQRADANDDYRQTLNRRCEHRKALPKRMLASLKGSMFV
jgi:hypothetical protein